MKAEPHPRESERLRALRSFGILDSEPEALFDELVALAVELLDVPVALVSLVDETRQWFKARVGFEPCQTSREVSFCAHAILDDGLLVVEDTLEDPRFADNALVVRSGTDRPIRFYAGAPLLTGDALPLGTLCVIDHRPRRFSARERRRLALLRDQAMALLERRRLQLEAELLSRRKSDFLAQVSHEIRTPLAAVLGYAELLEASLEKADDLDHVRVLQRNGRYLQSIVDDLLDLARVEAGKLGIERAPCALDELLSDIDAVARGRAAEKGIGWRVDCTDALPLEVLTDPLRLRQILVNLVGNALKFVEHGGVVLALASDTDARGGTVLEFAVHDTGIGMDAEQVSRVFAPFEQADTDTAARFGGSGLGLTISRELARLIGGELLAASELGVGSAFRLRLPCEPAGPGRGVPRLRRVEVADGEPGRAGRPAAGARLLVVDDEEDMRALLERTLGRAGFGVVTVGGGERALELLERGARTAGGRFDAVLLDMHMPVLDGAGVLRRMARGGLDVPVIALTADALDGRGEWYVAAGCRAYVTKPFAAEALVGTIASVIAGRALPTSPGGDVRTGPTSPRPAVAERGFHVLVVDDSDDLATAIARSLSRHGYRASTAGTARSALALAERDPPDGVLLDHGLPDMGPHELLGRLRAAQGPRRTRYVSLTGLSVDEAERRELGFDRYLVKPVALRVLLATLEELLGAT